MISPVWPFPPTSGGLKRIEKVLRGLASRHEVTFLSPIDRAALQDQVPDLPGLRPVPVSVSSRSALSRPRALLSPLPYHVRMAYYPRVDAAVAEQLAGQDFDLVYTHFIYPMRYLLGRQLRAPAVVDQHNVDRDYWRLKAQSPTSGRLARALAYRNLRKTVEYERALLPSTYAYVSVSHEDRIRTQSYASPFVKHFLVAPNGVDCAHFRPGPTPPPSSQVTLGFMGSLDLALNQDAVRLLCERVLPSVRTALPDHRISVKIIGRRPPDSLRRLERIPGVHFTGTVPDVVPHLQDLQVLVLPLREGAGTKLRTLEAMAVGVPVVGTALAFEGIDGLMDGVHALESPDLDGMGRLVARLVQDQHLRAHVRESARELVRTRYDWVSITNALSFDLEQVFRSWARSRS